MKIFDLLFNTFLRRNAVSIMEGTELRMDIPSHGFGNFTRAQLLWRLDVSEVAREGMQDVQKDNPQLLLVLGTETLLAHRQIHCQCQILGPYKQPAQPP
jgi:hypothetical protein